MNPFLLAFAGALAALLLVAVILYTYASIKIRPFIARMQAAGIIPPVPDDLATMDENQVFRAGHDMAALAQQRIQAIDHAIKHGARVVIIPHQDDLTPPESAEERDHLLWERDIVAVLNGRPIGDGNCPLCRTPFMAGSDREAVPAADVA